MEVRIQAINFDATEKLQAFINKKVERLSRRNTSISEIVVRLTLVKPETAKNKEAVIEIIAPQVGKLVADKTADTFEEAIDVCLEALDRQLEKRKNA